MVLLIRLLLGLLLGLVLVLVTLIGVSGMSGALVMISIVCPRGRRRSLRV